jgi:hypothetical protein
MYIIQLETNKWGARPSLQEWQSVYAPEGHALCPDRFYDTFYSTKPAGFVDIVVRNGIVKEMSVNTKALNEYIEYVGSLPKSEEPIDPVVNLQNQISSLEEALMETDEAAIMLYEANLALEEANAEQDEAIIELYEMIGA